MNSRDAIIERSIIKMPTIGGSRCRRLLLFRLDNDDLEDGGAIS